MIQKSPLLIIFLLIFHTTTFSQGAWELLSPSPTTNQMVGMYFINSQTGWSVGEYGTILKTTNGGDNWSIQEIPWLFDLTDVHFPTALTGYAIGTNGFIVKTSNGGESWEQLDNPYSNNLNRVLFRDENYGWAIGEKGIILHTSDGGTNWILQSSNKITSLNGIDLIGTNSIIIVGNLNTVLITHDDGQNWQPVSLDTSASRIYSFEDVYFLDELYGWIAGGANQYTGLLKTEDGGQTWVESRITGYRYSDYNSSGEGTWLGPIQQIYFFEDRKTGIGLFKASNSTYFNNIPMKTTSGGKSWFVDMKGRNEHYDGPGRFCVLDENKVICTGYQGDFRFSNNKGGTWYLNDQLQRWLLHLNAGKNGQLLAHRYCFRPYDPNGDIKQTIRSSDNGTTWKEFEPLYLDQSDQPLPLSVSFYTGLGEFLNNRDSLWLLQYPYLPGDTTQYIFVSTDFGYTYKEMGRADLSLSYFLTPDTLIDYEIDIIQPSPGNYKSRFKFNYSFDGGSTVNTFTSDDLWNFLTSWPNLIGDISAHYFFNGHKGFLIGSDGNIVKTENTGQSWANIYSGVVENLHDITFIDERTGFVVGEFGRILKTDDGGESWRKTDSGTQENIYSIGFVNDHEGWVGTENGLRYTTDTGETWQGVPLRYSHGKFDNLVFDDVGNGYAYNFYDQWIDAAVNNRPHSYTNLLRMKNPVFAIDDPSFEQPIPSTIKLFYNYPNPFNATTHINYYLPQAGIVSLKIFNIQGKLVRTIVNQSQKSGYHSAIWDGFSESCTSVSSGVYFYQLQSNNQIKNRKLILLK